MGSQTDIHLYKQLVSSTYAVRSSKPRHQAHYKRVRNKRHLFLHLFIHRKKASEYLKFFGTAGEKKLAFHKAQERYNSDISKLNKCLLQRCANTLTREQEFS